MTSLIVSAPPAPTIRARKALVFLDRETGAGPAGGADRRLVHALTAEGYAVRTAGCGAADRHGVGAFLDTVEPGDLLLVRWSTESGWGRGEFGALMEEFARRVERSDGAALLLVVDFGWLVTASPDQPQESVGRLRVRGEPVAAAAALTTSAALPGTRPGRTPSLTGVIADGIISGDADLDGDGTVTVGDLHRYAEERYAELGGDRRPYLLTYGEGELIGVAAARARVPDLGPAFDAALARLAVLGDAVPAASAAELAGRIYDVHLGEDARQLLRRAALLGEDEPLTPGLARLLTEGTPPEEALRELAGWGLLGRDTPFADPAVRRAAAARLPAEELAHVSAVLRRHRAEHRAVRPHARLTGDRWTIHDRLGHRVHAEAIAAFVRHPGTRPPLTIGVKGPWGAGKTSLMRMVQDLLDPGAAEDRPAEIHLDRLRGGSGQVTNAEVLARTRAPRDGGTEYAVPGELPLRHADWRPTVWFNPWMYQSGEQVWAGLAHEIISQVTGRLPRGERERFWLTLNLARIDREAVRRRAYHLAATRLLPVAFALGAVVLLTLASLAASALMPALRPALTAVAAAAGSGGSLIVLGAAVVRLGRFLGESADGAFQRLVRQPDLLGAAPDLVKGLPPDPGYRSKAGFLHLVQADMRRVLGMVATERRPLVVFVDDLDRCTPGTVAQVIEAVNLFLAGEFPNCVFVLAMEPEIVAAHVEAAYRDLARTLPPDAEERSGLGWRFLEKIVQLPLSVPLPDGEVPDYLRGLLEVGAPAEAPPPAGGPPGPPGEGGADARPATGPARPDPELVDRMEAAIRALAPTTETLDAVARLVQESAGSERPARPAAPADPARSTGSARPVDRAGAGAAAAGRKARRDGDGDGGKGSGTAAERPGSPSPTGYGARSGTGAERPAGDATGADTEDGDGAIGGLSAAVRLAADRVYDDLYSDRNAYAAIERMLPALAMCNPRELKRYVNVFRFYSFVTYRRALAGAPRAEDREVAKLAVLTIRWPHLLSLLARDAPQPGAPAGTDPSAATLFRSGGRPGTTPPAGTSEPAEAGGGPPGARPVAGRTVLGLLERAAARPGTEEWTLALVEAGLLRGPRAGAGRWDPLRALLATAPPVAGLARELL
ncbi:hypothetical protein Sru01_10730 [Sphaerisporangium rufum]|uniref:KAP NTPase domain-containing protein n=1 Tax=Sphaerisporangium rufum TaxID=1381558 RepID=A0A919UWJ8_9ACTN|nr:P-loop NTPase fold protein [Sphaerisporangium rufum]GII76091.1 hypothetical protein Sru01_10730 [Sphaerisporangium rufum]